MWNLHPGNPRVAATVLFAAVMIAASATTVAAAPPVYKFGTVNVSAGSSLDLDLGKKGFCDPGCDIAYWNAGGGSTSTRVPWIPVGTSAPGSRRWGPPNRPT
jgi:hypothetical protein